MTLFIGILITLFGLFFLALGMLFINYKLSPLKVVVKQEDVFNRPNFGIRIMIPGFLLLYLARIIFSK